MCVFGGKGIKNVDVDISKACGAKTLTHTWGKNNIMHIHFLMMDISTTFGHHCVWRFFFFGTEANMKSKVGDSNPAITY